jgi:hypothetical protein
MWIVLLESFLSYKSNGNKIHPITYFRLHTIQQVIKKQMLAAQNLREKISVGGYTGSETRENAVLRCLLNKSRPKAPERQELLRVRKDMELARFRVSMLSYEKSRKQAEMRQLEKIKSTLFETNQDRGTPNNFK